MAVKRIVANIATDHIEDAKAFYTDILGLNLVMDHGWILTFATREAAAPQISIATEGGRCREALDDLGGQAALIEVEGLVGLGDDEAGVEVRVYCHDGKSEVGALIVRCHLWRRQCSGRRYGARAVFLKERDRAIRESRLHLSLARLLASPCAALIRLNCDGCHCFLPVFSLERSFPASGDVKQLRRWASVPKSPDA
jgi:catechol 2,3-dioxygenase-like lactoylglutathione lyase family enzyme